MLQAWDPISSRYTVILSKYAKLFKGGWSSGTTGICYTPNNAFLLSIPMGEDFKNY